MNKLEKELILDDELNQYAYITIASTKDDVKLLRHHSYGISKSDETIDLLLEAAIKENDRIIKLELDVYVYYSYDASNDRYSIKDVFIAGAEILDTHDQNDLQRHMMTVYDALEVDLTRS